MEKKKKNNKPIMSIEDPRFRSFLMSILRRASRFWKPSEICIEKTRVSRGVHICPSCKKTCRRKDMKKDHINPVIPVTGFGSWDEVIKRLFVTEDKWQAICHECHAEKTKQENALRKIGKKEKSVLKLDED
jgi:hypothetical protein